MKKHLVIALSILCGTVALPAQMQTLKDAERAIKEGKQPAEVVAIVTPAFTNPETATLAQTYYIPGKAMFSQFDELFALKQFGKLPEGGAKIMADDIVQGYGFYMTALPLDSVADAKGKIKTKYSKDIINTIGGHFNDFNQAAVDYWEVREYENAYNAWEIYLGLAKNPTFAKVIGNNAPNDTILGEICFNQALAAWQADKLENAIASFERAKSYGYHKKQLYDYSLAVANTLKDEELTYAIAQEAQALYGAEDSNYFGFIINHYLQQQKFDEAFAIIDQAIANDPTNAQYYLVKGILYDNQSKPADAKAMFVKAYELNPENSQVLYNLGRVLCNEAYAISDNAPTTPQEYDKCFNEQIVPLFKEAAVYLEKAWELDNDNLDALNYLENVYYNLKDEQKLQEVQARKL